MTPRQYNELIRQAEVIENDKKNKEMREHQIKLYREIENAIIRWNNDGTKTAGTLTREVMGSLRTETRDEKEEEYQKDEYPVFGGPFTDALKPFEWLKKWYHSPKRK